MQLLTAGKDVFKGRMVLPANTPQFSFRSFTAEEVSKAREVRSS